MSASRKPVIVRRLTRDWCAGYADATPAIPGSAGLELLLSSGKLLAIPWDQVKWVCYVRDLDATESYAPQDAINPERLLRRRFTGRPRVAGVWLRLTLIDGDEFEGVAANDRSLIDGPGLLLTPPDTRSNTQRVYIPRASIRELSVLGVIHPVASSRERTGLQAQLFEMKLPSEPPAGSSPAELQSHP